MTQERKIITGEAAVEFWRAFEEDNNKYGHPQAVIEKILNPLKESGKFDNYQIFSTALCSCCVRILVLKKNAEAYAGTQLEAYIAFPERPNSDQEHPTLEIWAETPNNVPGTGYTSEKFIEETAFGKLEDMLPVIRYTFETNLSKIT